jgi:hypothetical protein
MQFEVALVRTDEGICIDVEKLLSPTGCQEDHHMPLGLVWHPPRV